MPCVIGTLHQVHSLVLLVIQDMDLMLTLIASAKALVPLYNILMELHVLLAQLGTQIVLNVICMVVFNALDQDHCSK